MSTLDKKTKDSPASATLTLAGLQAAPLAQQQHAGYADTLREILQQPATWGETAQRLHAPASVQAIAAALTPRSDHIVLTGSGSSMYIGECLAPSLQLSLGLPVQAIAAGTLLTHWRSVLPPGNGLLISLARSGDSPESCGVVRQLLVDAPGYRHLVLTCNAHGKLATSYPDDPRVNVVVLDERTNDRSLVMTSSFTNLLLAGSSVSQAHGSRSGETVERAAKRVQQLFDQHADALAQFARQAFTAAVYLGSGGTIGAAREGALKMGEMTAGKVITMAETFLGLRHGPMSSLNAATVVVALLSLDPAVRAYEYDLLRELKRKQLGMATLLVGEDIPRDLLAPTDLAIELPGLFADGEIPALLADVAVGQLFAFFRCLYLGEKPDTPSQGVLTRVVGDFTLHGTEP